MYEPDDLTWRVSAAAWREIQADLVPRVSQKAYDTVLKPTFRDTITAYIKVTKAYYAKHGAGGKPLWDTELNYGDRRARMPIKRVITGAAAARYVARTYLDSMRFGVSRVFWFGWDMHILGTDMKSTNSGRITAGGRAFIELQDWLVGKRWLGCSTNGGGVTVCWLATSKGSSSSVRYASRKQRVQIPRDTRTQ